MSYRFGFCSIMYDIYILLYTMISGLKGSKDRNETSEHLSEIRKKEQLEAAKLLNVASVDFFDIPDGVL